VNSDACADEGVSGGELICWVAVNPVEAKDLA